MTNLLALPGGTELVGDYKIKRVLGAGGFGITYLADEIALAREVTIKEYFPTDYAARKDERIASPRSKDCAADYKWGLERFITEAQTLARFDHPNIVRVFRYFRANNTGYMVLKFEEGQSLKAWLKSLKRAVRQGELDGIVPQLLDALEFIHKSDYLHRDIAPDNIMIRKDRTPVLIDFGSARGEIASHSRTVSALVKPGYSPYEQYATTTSQQGPWTDIYSLGATLYHAVTGKRPPDAPSRILKDEYIPARDAALSSYRPEFLAAIDKALLIEITDRPQTVAAWRRELLAPEAKPEKQSLGAALGLKRAGKKTAKVAPETPEPLPTAPIPPAPDAPQAKGQLLDFIDALRKPASPPAQQLLAKTIRPEPKAAEKIADPQSHYGLGYAGAGSEPAMPSTKKPGTRKAKPRAEPAATVAARQPPEQLPVPAERNRPARMSNWFFFLRQPWRGYAFKLGIGLGIATLAVTFKNETPRTQPRTATTTPAPSERTVIAPLTQLVGHKGPINRVGYARAGRSIVSIGSDSTLRLWDAEGGQLQRSLPLDNGALASVSIDDRTAIIGYASGNISIYDLERADKTASVTQSIPITAIAATPDQAIQAVALKGTSLALIDQKAPAKPVAMAEGHDGEIRALIPLLARSAIASGGTDKTVRLWSSDALTPIRTYRGHAASITALAAPTDGRAIASASASGRIMIWSSASNRVIRSFKAHDGTIAALAFAPSGDVIASASDEGQIRIWDARRERSPIVTIDPGRQGRLNTMSFSPDGRRLLTGHDDGALRVWEIGALKVARDER
jgi:serine/threonine protein kinase